MVDVIEVLIPTTPAIIEIESPSTSAPDAIEIIVNQGVRGNDGIDGINGQAGLSAFEIAVQNGFSGNEMAWLASLVGEKGEQGIQGDSGLNTGDLPVRYDATQPEVNCLWVNPTTNQIVLITGY